MYKLIGREVVACDGIDEWLDWYKTAQRDVKKTTYKELGNTILISTVFIGDSTINPKGGFFPLVFETMVFGGLCDGIREMSSTMNQAEMRHKEMVALVEFTEKKFRSTKWWGEKYRDFHNQKKI